MNKFVIAVIVLAAVVVIGLPLAGSLMKQSEPAGSDGDQTETTADTPADSPGAPAAAAAPAGAPAFDANSLVNTTWAMKVEGVNLNVTFFPGGALQAQSPMLKALVGTDTVQGQWSASGPNITVSASAGGRNVSETAVISGNQLLVRGQPAQRIR